MTPLGTAALWRGHRRFVFLDFAFGDAGRFLQTWRAWLDDPSRCGWLTCIAIAPELPSRTTLEGTRRSASLAPLAAQLLAAWPPPTADLHLLRFEQGRVQLQLAVGSIDAWLPRIEARVQAFRLAEVGQLAGPVLAGGRLFKRLARLAAPDALLLSRPDPCRFVASRDGAAADDDAKAQSLRRRLRTAGFEADDAALALALALAPAPAPAPAPALAPARSPSVAPSPPPGVAPSPRSDEAVLARYAPRFVPRGRPRRGSLWPTEPVPSHAVVVGGGLAGCAVAWALAEQGVCSTVLERRASIADAGSGNAAGLFHGVVHRDDARHARFNRAAALDAHRQVAIAIADHAVAGRADGLLRLETSTGANVAEMAATLLRLRLPLEHVRAVSRLEASRIAGVELAHPAWHFRAGGWVDPRGLARSYLARANTLLAASSTLDLRVDVEVDVEVDAIRRCNGRWQALDRRGAVIAAAPVLVLANGGDALRLLGDPDWPVERTRGQVSAAEAAILSAGSAPRLPITGSGYVLPTVDGKLWFGATSDRCDDDGNVRHDDHLRNVERLFSLLPGLSAFDPDGLTGRTAFRWSSRDRLPIAGAVPRSAFAGAADAAYSQAPPLSSRAEQARAASRVDGLFISAGLGSRGIAWSGLCAQVVAALVAGAAAPLPADLLDAVDPARFASRAHRRAGAGSASRR